MKKRGVTLVLSSKGQVSLFMVMALILLIAGALYFLYQNQFFGKRLEFVQPEIAPVKVYIDNCVQDAAESGLEGIGLSGGYINVPQEINNDPRAYLTTFPAAGFKIPYWWHNGIESVPTEEFIKGQLAEHIKAELKNCVNNFESFEGRFKINELKEPVVEVKLNENDVSVRLNYPLEVISSGGNAKNSIENFEYKAPIRLKKVYELAKLIMERENKDYFFETRTIDLYSMDRGIPTTDVEATCKTKSWRLSNIKEKLQTLLRVNLPYIRIKGTDYNPNLYVPNPSGRNVYSDTYFQQHYVWEIDKDAQKKYDNMKVSFAYENWPLDIYARPSENGVLRSNSQQGTDMLSFFCLHIWHFTYDIAYPVLVTIADKETAKNKNYRFSFAFKVNVDHNQPGRANRGTALFETVPDLNSEDYCNDAQNEVTIFTVNNATGEDIRDVNLTFACGRFYCGIGQSDWLSFGAAAGIAKRLPYCVNGVIKGSKEGFQDSKSFIQTDIDGRSYVLLLNPMKEFQNYKVLKHSLSSPSIAKELSPNQKASILLRGRNLGFESFAVYPKEAGFPLKLVGGKDATYEVSIYLSDDENIVGGYIGNWTLKKDDIRHANEIVFHVLEQGPATDDERFLFVSGLSSYSKNVPPPELK